MMTLDNISSEILTETWNRCWQGYFYDMKYSPEHLKVWLYLSHVSLEHSCAIFVEDKVVGFCLMSLDGSDGWIAGTCIDPDYRHQGLFGILIRAQLSIARHIGLNNVYLEVLKQNYYALKVYYSVGFNITRELNVYRVENKLNAFKIKEVSSLEPVTSDRYFEIRNSCFSPAWQRKEEYLRRYKHCLALMNLSETAGALFAGENNIPLLDIWSSTPDGAEEVITYCISQLSTLFSLTNQPLDLIVEYLSSQGISPGAQQFEMCISLS
jgi:Acetyltransferases